MRTFDALARTLTFLGGQPQRWLREELADRDVSIPLCEACVLELVRHADERTRAAISVSDLSYVGELRAQLAAQANFVQRWTASDEKILLDDEESLRSLVRIAHKYALPRPWKLSDPVATAYQRQHPSFWDWASASELPQS